MSDLPCCLVHSCPCFTWLSISPFPSLSFCFIFFPHWCFDQSPLRKHVFLFLVLPLVPGFALWVGLLIFWTPKVTSSIKVSISCSNFCLSYTFRFRYDQEDIVRPPWLGGSVARMVECVRTIFSFFYIYILFLSIFYFTWWRVLIGGSNDCWR